MKEFFCHDCGEFFKAAGDEPHCPKCGSDDTSEADSE